MPSVQIIKILEENADGTYIAIINKETIVNNPIYTTTKETNGYWSPKLLEISAITLSKGKDLILMACQPDPETGWAPFRIIGDTSKQAYYFQANELKLTSGNIGTKA